MIYIIGGSYAEKCEPGWSYLLAQKYKVKNLAKANTSNTEIFLKLSKISNKLTVKDFVVVVWAVETWPYIKNFNEQDEKGKEYLMENYVKYYNDEECTRMHYLLYLNNIESLLNGAKLICLWTMPCNYKPNLFLPDVFDNFLIKPNKHKFLKEFDNQIKPALTYFSFIESNNKEKRINDDRPNHIADLNVHQNIVKAVENFMLNDVKGTIDIKDNM